jgi:hypothetical protein
MENEVNSEEDSKTFSTKKFPAAKKMVLEKERAFKNEICLQVRKGG